MSMLLVFFPLWNVFYLCISEFILRKRINVFWIAHSYLIILFLCIYIFWCVCILGNFQYFTLGTWINCGQFIVNWGFLFDSLSVSMLLMVTIISSCVHFYSIGYMRDDSSIVKFISYLSLFTFFMFILVTGDNFIQLFLGWEGIGLCSYLLISFWNTRIQANKSAIKALILNRIGDFGFICGLVLIFNFFRSVDFATVFILTPFFSDIYFIFFSFEFSCLDTICFFLFVGSMGKSAQIGLHTWLPDAMEGPTPVSALIHAATLVTAGVFLIIRCSPIFELAPLTLFFILLIGGLTAFFAATVAITQDDIKKVIAYSTCSQLGYMIFICGLSSYNTAIFHLVNHAFFKALLFLGAGSVIHALCGEQDMRKYGKLTKLIPYTYNMLFIGCLALIGFPFLSGFYSKDLILEISFSKYSINGVFLHWVGSLSACLTAFYSFRLLYYTFWSTNSSFKYYIESIHELPKTMGFSLSILYIGSLFSGFVLAESFVGFGTFFWGNAIYISTANNAGWDFEYIPLLIKNTPFCFSIFGLILATQWNNLFGQKKFLMGKIYIALPQKISKTIWFFNNKWYFDYLYNYYFGYSLLFHSYETFYKLIDKGIIEICGPQGLNLIVYNLYSLNSRKQLGYIYHMSCLFFLGLIILIVFFI